MIRNKDYYTKIYNSINNNIIEGFSAPRGRILDINGNILVDNIGVKVVLFNEIAGISKEEKKDISNKLSTILEIDSNKIYKSMNNGYLYQDKLIKKDITDEELTKVNELKLNGIRIDIEYDRVYNYDTCLNDLFGTIGSITKENKNKYLNLGYRISDIVGLSYLEEYYEDYLKGEKAKYLISNHLINRIKEEKRGSDLILNIDINKQLYLESILKEEIKNAKKYPSSKYYNGSSVILSNVDGSIISLASFTSDLKSNVLSIINDSYTVGSVVKGASQSVAYMNNAITKDKKIKDSCVKLNNQKEKCSWRSLGYIDDIDALALSSNYYQFINVFNTLGIKYNNNINLTVSDDDFKMYRDIFALYGLGSKSGIDLIKESVGIKGSKISGDLLLNYSIGQYDTYTPLMLTSYINTIASNGKRYNLRLVKQIINNHGKKERINNVKLLNKVPIEDEDLKRIQKGFNQVTKKGTGVGYFNIDAAAKTGTSETFFRNIPTITRTIVSYFPYDNPIYSLSIISPNISIKNDLNLYSYPINSILSRKISDFLFEKS